MQRPLIGSPSRARTYDLRINSPSLYQLSYRGSGRAGILPDYFRDRVGDVVDVLRVERGDTDAAGVDGVDGKFLAQAPHLLAAQAGVREHAALLEHELEVAARRLGVDQVDEALAHRLDPLAHRADLALPQAAQLRAVQHGGDDLPAVRRRVGVIGAHDALQL